MSPCCGLCVVRRNVRRKSDGGRISFNLKDKPQSVERSLKAVICFLYFDKSFYFIVNVILDCWAEDDLSMRVTTESSTRAIPATARATSRTVPSPAL